MAVRPKSYVDVVLMFFVCVLVNTTTIISHYLTLYDPGRGGEFKTHLFLELQYCALGIYKKNCLTMCGKNNFDWGSGFDFHNFS